MGKKQEETFPPKWDVSSAEILAESATSRVTKVWLGDGRLAVVKALTAIGMRDELSGVRYLDWHDGVGAVRVLDVKDNFLLLEYAGERTLLDELDESGDEPATAIAVAVLQRLLAARNNGDYAADLIPIRLQFSSLFIKAERDRNRGNESFFVQAAAIADERLNNFIDVRPLHGDIHHENILYGERGWLVIDPKGLLGDPIYDLANMFNNPVDRRDLRENEARVANMARTFSSAFNRDILTILDYAMAHAALSASWHQEDEDFDEADRSLAVARVIQRVRTSLT